MTANVWLVARDDVPLYWQKISDAFHEFEGMKNTFTLEELGVLLMTSPAYNIWLAVDDGEIEGMLVTSLIRYPHRAEMNICAIAGENLRKYIREGLKNIEHYSIMMGVTNVAFDGRPEWERIMKRFGYKRELRMSKDIRATWGNS